MTCPRRLLASALSWAAVAIARRCGDFPWRPSMACRISLRLELSRRCRASPLGWPLRPVWCCSHCPLAIAAWAGLFGGLCGHFWVRGCLVLFFLMPLACIAPPWQPVWLYRPAQWFCPLRCWPGLAALPSSALLSQAQDGVDAGFRLFAACRASGLCTLESQVAKATRPICGPPCFAGELLHLRCSRFCPCFDREPSIGRAWCFQRHR